LLILRKQVSERGERECEVLDTTQRVIAFFQVWQSHDGKTMVLIVIRKERNEVVAMSHRGREYELPPFEHLAVPGGLQYHVGKFDWALHCLLPICEGVPTCDTLAFENRLSYGMNLQFGVVDGRAVLVHPQGDRVTDVERASGGAFSSDPLECFAHWAGLRALADTCTDAGVSVTPTAFDAPSPRARQIFGIGLNYRAHAVETGAPIPDSPLTFTKFPSSINAPFGDIPVTVPTCDWEVELVVVIGSGGRDIDKANGWQAVAGVCIGQDVSDRLLQRATQPPQFSLGKSRRGYSPFGPWLVDAHTLANRDNVTVSCTVNGIEKQRGSTDDLIFDVPTLVAYLSSIVELLPGDVIFTGTPSGVGGARKPPEFLKPGDVVMSTLHGVASITNRCV
jgi:2,4-didehydro-3-deoxy-L-rhamnonate hydrolase